MYDEAGRGYYDATSSWWSVLHGHCHPRLARAIARQADTLDHVLFAPHTHAPAVELSERLLDKMGEPFSRVFYSDDGSTAVEAALKMALQYWQNVGEGHRRYFLSIDEGYHGDTLGAVAVGYLAEFHHFFDKAIRPSFKATGPYCYRCPIGKQYPSCRIACVESAEKLIAARGDEIAALIVEPLVMGAAGMIVYPPEYLDRLVRACRDRGILVIFDEVFTGFGRTGKWFAYQHLDVRPDLVALSKGLTSGTIALGATVATESIYAAFCGSETKKFYHGHTFSANPIACAVALESLAIFDEENVMGRVGEIGGLLAREGERFAELPHVGEIRSIGAIWAVELVADRSTRREPVPANGPGWRIASALWERGIWARPIGNVMYCIPPYCSTDEEIRRFFTCLYEEIHDERHF